MLDSLSDDQLKAVSSKSHALVTACPGSGKTRVLAVKTIYTLRENQKRVAAVTFTKDSAIELKKRVLSMAESNIDNRLFVGTFHSLALQQLKAAKKISGWKILSGGQQFVTLRRAWLPFSEVISISDAKSGIDHMKSFADVPIDSSTVMLDIYRSYQEILTHEKAMDFSDILLMSVRMMRSGELTPLNVTDMFVDEAQDMDDAQYNWMKCHSDNGVIITLVGDDDQSIFGFRQALGYNGLMRFMNEHDAELITLGRNYRSDVSILSHAGRLISFNIDRVDKQMKPNSEEEGQVTVVNYAEPLDEAEASVSRIDKNSDETWGFLSRTNQRLDSLELFLVSRQISYKRVGGKSFWDGPEPSALVGLLSSVVDNRFLGISNVLAHAGIPEHLLKSFSITDTVVDKLTSIGTAMANDSELKKQCEVVTSLTELFPSWQNLLAKKRDNLVVFSAADWFGSFSKEQVAKLLTNCADSIGRLDGSLAKRIEYILGSRKKTDQDKVVLMSAHSSKGLEFDSVWLLGFEDGVMPHKESPIDEERRLAYVAMTRARHRLFISYLIGDKHIPSRFLKEAGLAK